MTKEKKVTIKMDVRTAAAVRQVLFDAQRGYRVCPRACCRNPLSHSKY